MRDYTLTGPRTYRSATADAPRASRPLPPQRCAGPLSNTQKAELSIGFRKAWNADGGYGDADAYRRAGVLAATGKPGLTACTQDDYLKCKAKIAELLREDGDAINHHIADQTAPQRVAMHKLNEACRRQGKTEAYVAAIARSRFKCSLADCSDKQLWWLVFTIKNRRS